MSLQAKYIGAFPSTSLCISSNLQMNLLILLVLPLEGVRKYSLWVFCDDLLKACVLCLCFMYEE